ncbi:hypothetical protein AB1N83_014347 [Pleurotus pulmonarius]
MRDRKIAVLAVQETHMDEDRRDQMEHLFGRRIRILASADIESPTQKAGVAIVLNKSLIKAETATIKTIIPGRAIWVKVDWNGGETLTVLAVYAPNAASENTEFWKSLTNFFDSHPRLKRPNVVLGDFNMVEDAIDRYPMHADSGPQTTALNELKANLHLVDGWRDANPGSKGYTFHQPNGGSKSRIDRIYIKQNMIQKSDNWRMEHSGIANTDHWMVLAKISNGRGPSLGRGRWSIPLRIIDDAAFKKMAKEKVAEVWHEMQGCLREERTPENNVQEIYDRFKGGLIAHARRRDKTLTPKILRDIDNLKKDLKTAENPRVDENLADIEKREIREMHNTSAYLITQKIAELERRRHGKIRELGKVKNRIEGETMSRYWMQVNRDIKPRDVIQYLKITEPEPDEDDCIFSSKDMAEYGREYHEQLQEIGRPEQNPEQRNRQILTETARIKAVLTEEQKETMKNPITHHEIETALKLSENNKAAGIDGLTYEFWKQLLKDERHEMKTRGIQEVPKVLEILKALFNDVEEHGTIEGSNLAEGWMCPIYKKGDRSLISNYRPITVLNTDYKLLTKALTIRIGEVSPGLLHKSQAGFVKGRRITDQTQLIKMVINYADITETNGAIVALDQEKAYDKIEHDYLWKVLEKFGIPNRFINTVKSLYKGAETRVMINGYLSSTFKVTRGVRQGDPLSCLLFDLGIEPLSIAIRESRLNGLNIPQTNESLKAILFADDTTVFLSEEDSLSDLNEILDKWCLASGAKFNTQKTQILPIGTEPYRNNVHATRKMNINSPEIAPGIGIVDDGEAIRILGAWMGNNDNKMSPWAPVMEKINDDLQRWDRSHPSIEGRKLVSQMVVGGRSQYLAQVQGMPKPIEDSLKKIVRKFVWGDKRNPVAEDTLLAPLTGGGRDLLDIRSRNDAINLMWAKNYLKIGKERPQWAYFADKIMAINVPKSEEGIPPELRLNPLTQSWNTTRKDGRGNPKFLQDMMGAIKRYNVRLEAITLTREALREMPIWYHKEANPRIRLLAKSRAALCLRNNHQIRSVGDTEDLAGKLTKRDHKRRAACRCGDCRAIRLHTGCEAPYVCADKASELLETLPEKWDPRRAPDDQNEDEGQEEDWQCFRPQTITARSLKEAFRVFTEGESYSLLPRTAPRAAGNILDNVRTVRLATDGSCEDQGQETAKAGAGVFYAEGDPRNAAIRVPSMMTQTNQVAEMLALHEAIRTNLSEDTLEIESDSRYTINAVTRGLTKMEDEGYLDTPNADLIRQTVGLLRMRTGRTKIKWVKGHNGNALNEGADHYAAIGRNEAPTLGPVNQIEPSLRLTGAKLQKLTQALAYKGIRTQILKKNKHKRRRTETVISMIQNHIEDSTGKAPDEKSIWKATRHPEFSRQIRYFMWMAIHDAFKIGEYWINNTSDEEYQKRGRCPHCDEAIETMEHILTKCETPGQREIWNLAGRMWQQKTGSWRQPWIGDILGCGTRQAGKNDKQDKTGEARLWKILISESAHLIWKLRCERVISNENRPFTSREVENKWVHAMNERLDLDKKLTHERYKSKSKKKRTVLNTWRRVLSGEDSLPRDWTTISGVLVGIGLTQTIDNG